MKHYFLKKTQFVEAAETHTVFHTFFFAHWIPLSFGFKIQNFIVRYGTEKDKIFDVILGLASGIPICCVVWFTFFRERTVKEWRRTRKLNVDYVPCPYCVEHKRYKKNAQVGEQFWKEVVLGRIKPIESD